jgi:hypothetical protein
MNYHVLYPRADIMTLAVLTPMGNDMLAAIGATG